MEHSVYTASLKNSTVRTLTLIGIFLHFAFIYACGHANEKPLDTATSGTITIAADESLKPIIDAEIEVFQAIYPDAHLNVIYTNEFDAIQLVLKDSARIAITSRELLTDEMEVLKKAVITPRYAPFCKDAIAVIMNKSQQDTVLTLAQLTAIMDGSYTSWKDLNSNNGNNPFQIVFDSPKSGAIRQIKDSLLHGKELAKHCFALKDNASVIDYVKNNKNAIGLIGVSWISDRDDSTSNRFLNGIQVCDLVPVDPSTAEAKTMKPYQAYIALKQYPLWRKVQIMLREPRVGLGTGFASFVASDQGQRIVLKSGLVPATAPVRIIQLNSN